VEYSVGWIFVYPQQGTITHVPSLCDLDYVMAYEAFVESGTRFETRGHCADAVASFLVKGTTEEEAKQNIYKAYNWFDNTAKWQPL